MGGPKPTHNKPIGTRSNQFKLDIGTLALSQMQPTGLQIDPWSHLNLAGNGSFIRIQIEAFVRMHRWEVFGAERKVLEDYAKVFTGVTGSKLKIAVMDAAKACRISAGLVAATMLFEMQYLGFWTRENFLMRGGLESLYDSGNDYFLQDRNYINRAVPAARKVKVVKEVSKYDKERKKVRKDGLISFDQLILATAAMVKYKEIIARKLFKREGHDFDSLRQYERFYFTRLAYNPGGQLLKTVRDFLNGKDVYQYTGRRSKKRPRRGATICTALALHLNETVFL